MVLISGELRRPEMHCDLWTVDLEQLPVHADELQAALNAEEIAHLGRFSNPGARRAFLGSRGFLRRLAAGYLQADPATLRLAIGAHGKPSLADFPELHFNISHSQNRLVLLFAPCQCGVDIESLGRQVDYQPIMKRFFGPGEIASWQAQSEPRQAFFRGWTRKEAYLKATGEGISGLGRVRISFAPDLVKAVTGLDGSEKPADFWHFFDFALAPNYVGSVALAGRDLPLKIKKLL